MPKGLFLHRYLFALLLSASMLMAGCDSPPALFQGVGGGMLGTQYHITAELPRGSEREVMRRAEELDRRMKREMSIFDKESQLSRINRGESDVVTPWIEQNIRLADSISRLSGGIYDITVAPLVRALGFAGGKPQEGVMINRDSLLQFVGYEGITIHDGRLSKRDPRMQIDLNSIAKGFAVDRLAEIIAEMGATNYMVEIGGEVRVGGHNSKGGAWRIGVETPFDGNMSDGAYLQQRVAIDGNGSLRSVATSGNYRRFYLNEAGEKIVHTIDPRTGLSGSSSLLSVTVLARSCAEADAFATMLLAAGDQRAESLAQEIDNCEVYLIYNSNNETGYRVYYTDGMRERLLDKID